MKNKRLTLFLALFAFLGFSQEVDITELDLANVDLSLIEDANIDDGLVDEGIDEDRQESLQGTTSLIESRKFGFNFINTSPTNISATTDLPVPSTYKISLNDELRIILSGNKRNTYNLRVNLDGSILFPEIGSVFVVGESFEEVKSKLRNLVNNTFVGVNLDLSLSRLNAKKITIVGAVRTPGTYLVNPFTTISNSLAYAGGVRDFASLRSIKVLKPGGESFSFDLYQFLVFGNRANDLILEAGDTVLVEGTSKFIEITGEVLRPGIYEYLEGESIDQVLEYTMGFTGIANKNNISISKVDENLNVITESIEIKNDDYVDGILTMRVFPIATGSQVDILVEGEVTNAGIFDFEKYKDLKSLINDLNFTNDLYPYLAVLEQFDKDKFEAKQFLFSLEDKTTYENINLKSGDKVFILSKDDYGNIAAKLSERTKKLLNDYTLDISFDGLDFELPVVGSYRIIDFINFLGLDKSELDSTRVILSSAYDLDQAVGLTEIIKMVQNQNVTLFKKNKLQIIGPAKLRGNFELKEKTRLSDLLMQISFDESIYPFSAVVEQFDPIKLERSSYLFNINDANTHDIPIDNYSTIYFLSQSNFNDLDSIGFSSSSEQLMRDYSLRLNYREDFLLLPVYGSQNLEDLLNLLTLDLTDIESGRTTYVQPIIDQTYIGKYQDILLETQKYHSVSLRFENTELINVRVLGEINFPGNITVDKKTSIKDIYRYMGGFTDFANEDGVIFQRESVRSVQIKALRSAQNTLKEFIAINAQEGNQTLSPDILNFISQDIAPEDLGRIGGDFSGDSKLINDFLLEDGDVIYVPRKFNTVTVIGEVLNPNTVVFDKKLRLNDYIISAGGYKEFAKKSDIYIIKANGLIEKRRKNIFLGTNKLEPGDVIVVPRDMVIRDNFSDILGVATNTLYNLSFSAAALNALQNN